jgi:hypothetical protein
LYLTADFDLFTYQDSASFEGCVLIYDDAKMQLLLPVRVTLFGKWVVNSGNY